jgi:uncharacterized membrane protein YtjA (UPF0391 family)
MLYYTLMFFVIAVVAAIFGFGGIALGAAKIAQVLFFVCLALFVIAGMASLFGPGQRRRG